MLNTHMHVDVYIWLCATQQGDHNPTRTGKPGRTRTNKPDSHDWFAKPQHDLARKTAPTNWRGTTRESHKTQQNIVEVKFAWT